MIGGRHRSNMELWAGSSEHCLADLRRLPATGAIARTATNVKNAAPRRGGMTHA